MASYIFFPLFPSFMLVVSLLALMFVRPAEGLISARLPVRSLVAQLPRAFRRYCIQSGLPAWVARKRGLRNRYYAWCTEHQCLPRERNVPDVFQVRAAPTGAHCPQEVCSGAAAAWRSLTCSSSGGWVRDLTAEGVEPNPGPTYRGDSDNDHHEPETGDQRDAPAASSSLVAPWESNRSFHDAKAFAATQLPRSTDLGGVTIVPTQMAPLACSDHYSTRFAGTIYPREFVDRIQPTVRSADGKLTNTTQFEKHIKYVLPEELVLTTPQQIATSVAHAPLLVCNLYRGTGVEDTREVVATVKELDTVMTTTDDKSVKKVEAALGRFREMGTRGEGTGGWRARLNDRLERVTQLYATSAGGGQRYLRWFTCAWLDLFTRSGLQAYDMSEAYRHRRVEWASTNYARDTQVHVLTATPPQAAAAGAVVAGPVYNGENALWDNLDAFLNNEAFLIDASETVDVNRIRMVGRYAASYPPNRATVCGNQLLSQRIHIPGAARIAVHIGDRAVAAGLDFNPNLLREGDISRSQIRDTIRWMAEQTGAYEDCAAAFEIAAARAFGVDNRIANTTKDVRVYNAMFDEDAFQLPRDVSIPAYFYPFRTKTRTGYAALDIVAMPSERIFEIGRLFNLSLMVGRQWAFKASSLTGLTSLHRGEQTRYARHFERLTARASPDQASILDVITANAVAHMYHWAPALVTLNTSVMGVVAPLRAHNRLGHGFRRTATPFLLSPYHSVWAAHAVPDFMMFAQTNGVVKWEAGKEYPLKNSMTPISKVRLGATFAPLTYQYWIGDGGAEYSAQYYVACNGDMPTTCTGPEDGAVPAPDIVEGHVWNKPYEFDLPSGAPILALPRMADPGLEDFMVPGTLTSYNHDERITRAFGLSLRQVRGEATRTSKDWLRLACKETGIAPALVYCGPKRIQTSPADLEDYTLMALSNRETNAFAGMRLVPTAELLQPRVPMESADFTRYAGVRALETPAALANDNSPESGGPMRANLTRSGAASAKTSNRWIKATASAGRGVVRKAANANTRAELPQSNYYNALTVHNGQVAGNSAGRGGSLRFGSLEATARPTPARGWSTGGNDESAAAAKALAAEVEELQKALAEKRKQAEEARLAVAEMNKAQRTAEASASHGQQSTLNVPVENTAGSSLRMDPQGNRASYATTVMRGSKPAPPSKPVAPNDERAMQVQAGAARAGESARQAALHGSPLDTSGTMGDPMDGGRELPPGATADTELFGGSGSMSLN